MPESNERSAEFLRGAIAVCDDVWQRIAAAIYRKALAAAEAREALQGSKEEMALSRIHEIASRQLAEPAGAGDAVAMAKICTEVEAVQLPAQPIEPTAAEVIEACEKALSELSWQLRYPLRSQCASDKEFEKKSAEINMTYFEINKVVDLIARWKEANGGK